ncbi:MAG: hypothetical protein AAF443_00015 [Chlamydiota bacterium]
MRRLVRVCYPDNNHFSYTYDYNSNLRSVEGPRGTTNYTYDPLNRMTKAILPDKSEVAYAYDPMGRVTHLTYPDGEVASQAYDHRGRLSSVTNSAGCLTYEYDDLTNLVVKETFPDKTTTKYTYDTTPQVLEVCHRKPDGSLISRLTYAYESSGQITVCKEETPLSVKTTHYTYDKLDHLTELKFDSFRNMSSEFNIFNLSDFYGKINATFIRKITSVFHSLK